MSIHKTSKGEWGVRWRAGGRHRSKLVGKREMATRLDEKIRQQQRLGGLDLFDRGTQTLDEFAAEWRARKWPTLSEHSRRSYRTRFNRHIHPHLAGYRLRDLTVEVLEDWVAQLPPTNMSNKAIQLLGMILRAAERRGEIPSNPVALLERPHKPASAPVRPLSVKQIEALRAHPKLDRPDFRLLISLMGYAGLRPQEALALEVDDIGERTLLIDKALAFGKLKATKTRAARSVRLIGPLASELAEYRLETGIRSGPLFRWRGRHWSASRYGHWRDDHFSPAARELGIKATPYALRHTFASGLIFRGWRVPEVARELGHSVQVCQDVYVHCFDEVDPDRPRPPLEDAIQQVRCARDVRREQAG